MRVTVDKTPLSSRVPNGTIKVAIIEDDPEMLAWLIALIASAADLQLTNSAATFHEGCALINAGGYDVLLCDLGLPDGDGIDLIRKSAALHPKADVMVITLFAEQRKVVDCIRAGARGYLLKGMESDECIAAIREIWGGGSPINPVIARRLLLYIRPEASQSDVQLSEREREILNMVARGFSKAECADLLGLSINTIRTHVKNIYRKLEVNSRAEAVFEASHQGILD
jgi:DNA-binding NarL/FixJ family response regulator